MAYTVLFGVFTLLMMIGMPIGGWLILSGEGKAIPFFGLDLPPPPPPPKSPLRNANVSSSSPPSEQRHARTGKSPRKGDNVDNVDMDLSDEDMRAAGLLEGEQGINLNVNFSSGFVHRLT